LSLKNKIINKFSVEGNQDLGFFLALFFLCLYLSYNINFVNRKAPLPEISFDKAGYYVYLPATFIYGWNVNRFPAGIEKKCQGFLLDRKNNKVVDKTTCGVALLWMPFFLVTHFIAVHWDLQPDGFSDFYEKMSILPGVFYLVLGIFFLSKFLRHYFSRKVSYLTVLLLLAGTNLYYYGIDEGLMSHVNSFFIFSLFLFLLKRFLDSPKKSYALFLGLSIVLSLAILIRPTNILLMTWMPFLDVRSWKEIRERLVLFLKPAYFLIFLITAFIVFLPQLLYWKYLSGNFLFYSYPGESFTNWNQPQMISVWFSPLNGFFLYTPLALSFLAGMVIMIIKKIPNGIFIGLSFLLISYVFASWYCWYFGGSFGYRPLVEYYVLFSLPFAFFISRTGTLKNLYIRSLLILTILFSVYYNLSLTYHQRWNHYATWSWDDYLLYLDYARLYQDPGDSYTWIRDFENNAIMEELPTRACVHSPTLAGYVSRFIEFNGKFTRRLDDILKRPVRQVDASVWINPGKKVKTGILFVCKIEDSQKRSCFYSDLKADDFITKPGSWNRVSGTFEIPEWIDQTNIISFTIWNFARTDTTYIDDIRLRFE
jgi:hypothetical protein